MPCGGCKKHTPTYSSPSPASQPMPQSAPGSRMATMANVSSSDLVTVELVDGNLGDHPISFGGTFYGYKSSGDRFKMLRDHAVSYRAVRILEDRDLFPVDEAVVPQRSAPPPPKPVVETKPGDVPLPAPAKPSTLTRIVHRQEYDDNDDQVEETITLTPEVFDFTQLWV